MHVLGERKKSSSSKFVQFLLLDRVKARWPEKHAAQGFHFINSFISNFFGPNSKTCTCSRLCISRPYCIRILWNLNLISHTKNQLSTLKNKRVGKLVQNARCALQNVHCAVVLGQIWAQGTNGLEKKSLCCEFQYIWSKFEETLANKL